MVNSLCLLVFKPHPVLVNLLQFKFALWFMYAALSQMLLYILAMKQMYLNLAKP